MKAGQGTQSDERELCKFARANLAQSQGAYSVTFVNELPKTATGKIQKYILRVQRTAIAPQSADVTAPRFPLPHLNHSTFNCFRMSNVWI
jgi:acyl-coenzyme A synthetase/AMP-(fatty) acid ligase